MTKRKRAPRPGEGRPARSDGPSSNFVVRLSATERATLAELTERLGEESESDTLRRALAELAARVRRYGSEGAVDA